MDKDKSQAASSQAKMDRYTVPPSQNGLLRPDPPLPHSSDTGTVDILQAIQASWLALEMQFEGVQTDVSLIRQDLRNVVDRMTEAEGRISELEDTVQELCTTVSQLTSFTHGLEVTAEDAENHTCRNYLHFVGVPEGSEGSSAESLLERWLLTWLPSTDLSSCFVIERAHRSLTQRPRVGAPASDDRQNP